MRNENEILELILGIAKEDKRIRAVYMNGSRTNPHINKDVFQDYDIVFVVDETLSFLEDKDWINLFGEIAIVQEPDSKDFGWGNDTYMNFYTWLMLFKDGNRIDLRIEIKDIAKSNYLSDTLTVKLLDKDNFLPEIPPANDKTHWVQRPTKEEYLGCCNEFWWCLNNVAKGIARNQIPYVMRMYNDVVHTQLDKMIEYYIGIDNDFSISVGMWGKYFSEYLQVELYEMYLNTYSDSDIENLWNAIFTACDLFRHIATRVSEHLGYVYNTRDDDSIMLYMNNIKSKLY